MRHPRRGRNVALAVAAFGFLASGVAWAATGNASWRAIVGVLGLKIGLVATVLAVIYHISVARRYDRLMRGVGVLARWRIDAARWQAFCADCDAVTRNSAAPRNAMRLPVEIPPAGLEVVITHNALWASGEFYPIQPSSLVRWRGPAIEFEQRVPAGRYRTAVEICRLPMPEGTEAEAARIREVYAQRRANSHRSIRKVALVLLVVMVAILIGIVVFIVKR